VLLLLNNHYFISFMPYTYQYPRPSLTTDAVVFRVKEDTKQLLLIQRKFPPYKGKWALPGGFMDMDETLEQSAARELEEETGLKGVKLQQLKAFSTLERDPRGRTISVIFWGVADKQAKAVAGDDAAKAQWFDLAGLPPLAFDHKEVVETAVEVWKAQSV
jgi:8-oxo-dGTP diphosphatase